MALKLVGFVREMKRSLPFVTIENGEGHQSHIPQA